MPSIDTINFNPLFYDVLSGEFKPPQDTKGQTHTLGRLAVAVFYKGAPSLAKNPNHEVQFSHPSWAPGIAAYVEYEGSYRADNFVTTNFVTSVRVRDIEDQDNFLLATLSYPHTGERELALCTAEGNVTFPLALSEDLDQIKQSVTAAAQDFFDKAA
jgi:hypothetical protein